jgi:hypothetical protein
MIKKKPEKRVSFFGVFWLDVREPTLKRKGDTPSN